MAIQATLQASAWAGTEAPYTQTVAVTGLVAALDCAIRPSKTATAAQRAAYRSALACITGQADGAITVTADGTKPAADIPIEVILSCDARVTALENILQGNGSYTSDYSGEEIDAMLAWVATQMGGST
ncbi:hypothetical protein [Lawsonibacter hominis]|uniref:Uncharacterized protein n=1 Tax=Lawsonibacter hominis TaxID=2763053 RepID=A0A8J6JH01_9FIRM|nr:hypothetical protein [Lawsonibacter hominis]MBC5735069.1 hypothetical protein [Lawsonibacter hominis]